MPDQTRPPETGLKKFCSAIGRLFSSEQQPAAAMPAVAPDAAATPAPEPAVTIHPGLTDQQLIVILTAAACQILDGPVRIKTLHTLAARNWSWVAQGRSELQYHRLK